MSFLADECKAMCTMQMINMEQPSAYVRISEIKKQAVQKLIDSVDMKSIHYKIHS